MEYDRSLSDVWKNTDPAGIFSVFGKDLFLTNAPVSAIIPLV